MKLQNSLKMALILCGSSALRWGWKAGRRLLPPRRLLFISVFMSNTPISSVRAIAVGDCVWFAACQERMSQRTPEPGYTSTWLTWTDKNQVRQIYHIKVMSLIRWWTKAVNLFQCKPHMSINVPCCALALRAAPPQFLHVGLTAEWCLLSHVAP